VLGAEGAVLRRQLARFAKARPDIRVVQRATPDAADQRHQLYVQWLNAGASEPDILQLDVVWTPEFAAAGWILDLDRFRPPTDSFFPATIAANRWNGRLYALPWFVDVGMLYWRTDLMAAPPQTFDELERTAAGAQASRGLRYGLVWQGARYEGLVTVFSEYLGGFGGRILDGGRVTVGSPAAVRALTAMRDEIYRERIVPPAALTWHEEESRFAFQNGESAFMRNWPYAYALMEDSSASRVAGRFAVVPMPAAPGGRATAALGGAQLAINAHSDHPEAAWAVIEYLTRPEQMLERARGVGQFPTRRALYDDSALAHALEIPPAQARAVIEHAVPRPVTPVYTQLSDILQVDLHRALTRQQEPAAALAHAAAEMQALLDRSGLGSGAAAVGR
jgi:multiple sugar transport system substrate-binding protein